MVLFKLKKTSSQYNQDIRMAVSASILETGKYVLNATSHPPKGTDLSNNPTGRATKLEAKKRAIEIKEICLRGKYFSTAFIILPK